MEMNNGTGDGALVIDTLTGPVIFPPVVVRPIPELEAPAPADNGNQKVLIGSLAIVLMVLAYVGLRSHND